MMKRILMLFLVIAICLPTLPGSTTENAVNLCRNGGFEGNLDSWWSWGQTSFDTEEKGSGASSLRLEANEKGGSGVRMPIALLPYETYSLGACVKAQAGTTQGIKVGIMYESDSEKYERVFTYTKAEMSFEQISFTMPRSFQNCSLYVWNPNSNGACWVDDVILQKGAYIEYAPASMAADVQGNMIANGNFEKETVSPWNAWGELTLETEYPHTGSYAMKVGNQKEDGGGGGTSEFTLKPFGTYVLTAWGRYDQATSKAAMFGIQYNDEQGKQQEKKIEFTDGNWTEKTLTFTMPQVFSAPTVMVWKVDTSQNFYLDDISLIEVKNGEFTTVVDGAVQTGISDGRISNKKPYLRAKQIAELAGGSVREGNNSITLQKDGVSIFVNTQDGKWSLNGEPQQSQVVREFSDEKLLAATELLNALGVWAGYNSTDALLYVSRSGVVQVTRTAASPKVNYVSRVAPDILAVRIDEGTINRSKLIPYQAQETDEVREGGFDQEAQIHKRYEVFRNGVSIGLLAGPEKKYLTTLETVTGDALSTFFASMPESYIVNDTASGESIVPVELFRKSKASGRGSSDGKVTIEHYIYLKLPHALDAGKTYDLVFNGINVQSEKETFVADAKTMRSEAIHTNQVGHRPDDVSKKAFLSVWMGTGGSYSYLNQMQFNLIKDDTGEVVYTGNVQLSYPHDKEESLSNQHKNQTYTDVYTMDYSDFTTPGTYRLYIEDIGCSYPIEISDTAWNKALTTAMMGFYHARGSVELGAPYTDFVRPRDHHPDDGFLIYQSTARLMDTGNGINAKGNDTGNFGNLLKGATTELVPEAIGGYQDAGDWDRRITHLEATSLQLDLLHDFPERLEKITWSIPESGNGLPDLLNEAMFGVDLYKRLQTADGGIRGGFEFQSHPNDGEPSWLDSQVGYVYAPDCFSSYYYVHSVARIAVLLEKYGRSEQAQEYLNSALRAMEWAEKDYVSVKEDAAVTDNAKVTVRDLRNAAALEMYIATNDSKWHDVFLEDTKYTDPEAPIYKYAVHDQRVAAYRYARLDDSMANAGVKENCRNAILKEAESLMDFIDQNAFNLGYDEDWGQPLLIGYYTVPQAHYLAQAYVLTGEEKYMEYLQKSALYSAGANPMNKTFTVGLGYDYPREVFKIDSRLTGQDAPTGIIVYGTQDLSWEHWANQYVYNVNVPMVTEWPNNEGFFDAYGVPMTEEWTVHQTSGPGAYLWGVLAGR